MVSKFPSSLVADSFYQEKKLDFLTLNQPCIFGENPTWSWCIILLVYCWTPSGIHKGLLDYTLYIYIYKALVYFWYRVKLGWQNELEMFSPFFPTP